MIITRTTESIHYRHPYHAERERTPYYFREMRSKGADGDIIEISADARKQLMQKALTPLAKAAFQLSPEIGELIAGAEHEEDLLRQNMIAKLHDLVGSKIYNFDENVVLERSGAAVVEILMARR